MHSYHYERSVELLSGVRSRRAPRLGRRCWLLQLEKGQLYHLMKRK